jgi:2-polyprenyl-6-methoxyphenol hydroxylase-like FAD-dependent oxidoreductase
MVRLYFTRHGAVESFTMPEGKRRWIIETPGYMDEREGDYLEKTVEKRTGMKLQHSDKSWESPFGVQKFLAKHYYDNRVILSGDAAHIMPPIGGQGMNTGFADAEYLASIICGIYREPSKNFDRAFRMYEKYRKIAFVHAERRAWLSMKIGTIKGGVLSCKRNLLITIFLKIPVIRNYMPVLYSMLTIPYGRLNKVKVRHI